MITATRHLGAAKGLPTTTKQPTWGPPPTVKVATYKAPSKLLYSGLVPTSPAPAPTSPADQSGQLAPNGYQAPPAVATTPTITIQPASSDAPIVPTISTQPSNAAPGTFVPDYRPMAPPPSDSRFPAEGPAVVPYTADIEPSLAPAADMLTMLQAKAVKHWRGIAIGAAVFLGVRLLTR